jgi:hypothetical protein
MFPLTIFSAGLGLIGIGVAVDGLLSTALIVLGLATCVGSAFLFLFRGNEAPAGEGHTVKGGRHAQAAGGDAYMAGRDIHINPLEDSRGLSRAAQLRQVRDEIQHILRRCGQLEKHRKEWETVWPVKSFAPYQRLPAEKWNAHGAALHLPQEDHDLIQAAYELANDFNVVMERGPQTYGDPEPDLDGLRQAFEQAAAALPVDGQPAGPSPPLGPYAQATGLDPTPALTPP